MKYSLKDLFLGVTLITIGLTCLMVDWRTKQVPVVPDGLQIVFVMFLPFAGIALIGAGAGAPFHHKKAFSCVAIIAFALAAMFTNFWPWLLNLL